MRAQLETLRDQIIDSPDLADMTNSQLMAVADGLAKMIEVACMYRPYSVQEPVQPVLLASLDQIDERIKSWVDIAPRLHDRLGEMQTASLKRTPTAKKVSVRPDKSVSFALKPTKKR